MPRRPPDESYDIPETTERIDITDGADRTEVTARAPEPEKFHGEKKPCLTMVEGDFLGEVYALDKPSVTIGRSEECDISIPDTSISRRHAEIRSEGGGFALTDTGSTNGVIVNGVRVKRHVLEDSDKIILGRVVLRFGFHDPLDKDYHEKLRNLAIRDGLTRIFNKRYFLDVLQRELHFAERNGIYLSLIVFDIDDFKRINDTYGHTVGDMVLRTIAGRLNREVRGYDMFARYGGEEFVFFLRGVSRENTERLAERVRKIVESHPFRIRKKNLPVTISVGYAVISPGQKVDGVDAFVDLADRGLYVAKREGKNRVCCAQAPLDR